MEQPKFVDPSDAEKFKASLDRIDLSMENSVSDIDMVRGRLEAAKQRLSQLEKFASSSNEDTIKQTKEVISKWEEVLAELYDSILQGLRAKIKIREDVKKHKGEEKTADDEHAKNMQEISEIKARLLDNNTSAQERLRLSDRIKEIGRTYKK